MADLPAGVYNFVHLTAFRVHELCLCTQCPAPLGSKGKQLHNTHK